MKNLEIARILFEIADLLEMMGVQFKPRAYRKAAMNIESLAEDIEVIYKQGKLGEIPGVGKSIEEKIVELIETGKLKYLKKLKKKIPIDVEALMEVPGLGPKRIKLLYRKLKIKNLKDLERAAKKHEIRKLKTFDEIMEENILKGIELVKGRLTGRLLLGVALPIARELKERIGRLKEVKQIEVAGSLRRRLETIGDLDILVTSSSPKKVMGFFCSLPDVKDVMAKGPTKSMVRLKNGLEVDLRVLGEKSFGSALQYFTGSKAHNIKLRTMAIKKGLKLNEYGLFKKKTGKQVAGKTEKEVYNYLGLPLIPPELREDLGEIEAAEKKALPQLINYNDLKGDLHCHTKWSEGVNSIEEVIETCRKLGYRYVGITDHTKFLAIARGMTEKEILKQKKAIDKINDSLQGFQVISGVEANILKDGKLDIKEKILNELDYVAAGIHSSFKMPKKEMTARICTALETTPLKILAHPTGRMINKRPAYELDMEKVIGTALANNCFLEINATPFRLDLNGVHVKQAVEKKLMLSIGSDAHNRENIHWLELGIAMARRGWAEKKDIVNTRKTKEVLKLLKKK